MSSEMVVRNGEMLASQGVSCGIACRTAWEVAGWVASTVTGQEHYTELDRTAPLPAETISPPDVKPCAILEWCFAR